jgi:hypothetical protein
MAFDGNNATWWNTEAIVNNAMLYQWAAYQFATPKTIMQMAVQRTSGMSGPFPNTVIFQFSDDGVCWGTACWGHPDPSSANDTPVWFNFANALPVNTGTDFGSHKHWLVQIALGGYPSSLDVGWSAIAEIAFKDDAGAAISTAGATPHDWPYGGTEANLYDSNTSTLWDAGNVDQTLGWTSLEFATAKKVMQIAVAKNSSMNGSSAGGLPRELAFMWSDNGTEFVNVGFAFTAAAVNDVLLYFNLAGAL